MTNIDKYQTPAQGTLDWHIPLNENFDAIESDVQTLASEVGVSEVGGYSRPAEGTLDWHIPLNENFDAIEADLETLASEAGISDVGGYTRPAQGSLDWHIPLNDNFDSIHDDLTAIANALESTSPFVGTQTQTLSVGNIWLGLVANYGTDDDTVVDVSTYSGSDLGAQFDAAVSDATASGTRPVFVIPPGNYTWSTTVKFNTLDLNGPTLLAHPNANIDVTVQWALDLSGHVGELTPDVDSAFRLIGGSWAPQYGVLRQHDSFRGEFSPDTVTGGTIGLKLLNTDREFCEGWTFRDTTYDGVSRPLVIDPRSGDQQLLANLTFRDFDIGYDADLSNITTQNWAAINCRFENPRAGAIGMKPGNYCTGTAYNTVWSDDGGTVFDFNDSGTVPTLVDSDPGGATLWTGQYDSSVVTTNDTPWARAQRYDMFDIGGQTLPKPVVRTDSHSGGDLPSRIESVVADLPNGGTILVPSAESYAWPSTASIDLSGRDIRLVTTPGTRIDVSASGWTLDVSGDGTFGVYGGDWHTDSDPTGWCRCTATNFDVSVKQVRGFSNGQIVSEPATNGNIRIFDTKFHGFEDGAAVTIGGAGVRRFMHTTCEYSYGDTCIRLDSPVDRLECVRVSSHTFQPGSVFADTNAPVRDGAWHDIKFESFREPNQTVFDNSDTSQPGGVVDPIVLGGDETIALWTGTQPRTLPTINERVATKFEYP